MRLIFFLSVILVFNSCSVNVVLINDLTDKQACRLYKASLKQKTELKVLHNSDSTYALMVQSAALDTGDPCSFLLIELEGCMLVLTSINKYRDVQWQDKHTLKLKKNVGVVKVNTDPKQVNPNSFYDYYDVESKEITEVKQTKQERP